MKPPELVAVPVSTLSEVPLSSHTTSMAPHPPVSSMDSLGEGHSRYIIVPLASGGGTLSGAWWKLPPRDRLPALPAEIWLAIFEHATFVQGAFETDIPDPFALPESQRPTTRDVHAGLRGALVTKRHLTRVCKTWRALATPILYRALMVRKVCVLPSLREILQVSRRRADAEEASTEGGESSCLRVVLGACTRRLDIVIGTAFDRHGRDEALFSLMEDVARCLSQLEIFTVNCQNWLNFRRGLDVSSSIVAAMREVCAPSLRVLEWTNESEERVGGPWAELAVAAPNLRVFRVPVRLGNAPNQAHHFHDGKPPSLEISSVCHLASCSLVDVHDADPHVPMSWGNHNMEIRLDISWSHGLRPSGMLQCFGSKVSRLVVSVRSTLRSDWLLTIGLMCPSVQQLVIILDTDQTLRITPSSTGPIKLPPSVTHLGLQFRNKYPGPRDDYRILVKQFEGMRAPSLRVARLMDKKTVVHFLRVAPGHFEKLASLLKVLNVRLEDQNGEELVMTTGDIVV